ncbi:MAG: acylphosphatase [Proteobacteria bacterium]|nr:acylphosphatase [Pseudomonadota bacterium]
MKKQVEIIVQGRVQGVFYRASTLNKAVYLDLLGTVTNLNNGSVKIICQGDIQQINKMIEWCWTGPPGSTVSNVIVTDQGVSQLTDFRILY